MKSKSRTDNCALFAAYAGKDPHLWKAIEGQEVNHTSFGRGVVVKTGPGTYSDTLYIWVRFEDSSLDRTERQFATGSFANSRFFSHLTLPEELQGIDLARERRRQQVRRDERQRQISERRSNRTQQLAIQREQRRKRDVQRICLEHNVTTLIHFTRVNNLRSILDKGLLGRSTLQAWPQARQPLYNDHKRLEGYRAAVSLSVSFPNYRMFHKYSRENRAQWVILLLAVSVLWELDCAFCQDNAAASAVTRVPLTQRKRPDALECLFADFNQIRRQDLQIPDHYPTNPQAEVLVFDPVPPWHVKAVHFFTQQALQRWLNDNAGFDPQGLRVSRRYFQPREDWRTWSSAPDATVLR
jgi:hypothetical protein